MSNRPPVPIHAAPTDEALAARVAHLERLNGTLSQRLSALETGEHLTRSRAIVPINATPNRDLASRLRELERENSALSTRLRQLETRLPGAAYPTGRSSQHPNMPATPLSPQGSVYSPMSPASSAHFSPPPSMPPMPGHHAMHTAPAQRRPPPIGIAAATIRQGGHGLPTPYTASSHWQATPTAFSAEREHPVRIARSRTTASPPATTHTPAGNSSALAGALTPVSPQGNGRGWSM